jgi:hypothetical protein
MRQDRCTTRSISFVLNLVVSDTFKLAGSFFDRSIDVLGGHTCGASRKYRGPQAGIGIDIAAAHARRHCNFLD